MNSQFPIDEFGMRVEAERRRHDRIYSEETGHAPNLVLRPHAEYVPNDLRAAFLYALQRLNGVAGRRVLEVGAGTGWDAVVFARRGASVVATDVSRVGVDAANRRFAANGVAGQALALEMPAERLEFGDDAFDAVFGRGVLHHLDMQLAPREMARVLKPGGVAVFMEPLSENPLLDFARDYLPYPDKKSPRGHRGVTYAMLHQASTAFTKASWREFYITSALNRAFGHHHVIQPLERLDDLLVARVKPLRRFARYVVVTYSA